MSKCKGCDYYDNEGTYPGTGYCLMNDDYVKEDDACEDFSE